MNSKLFNRKASRRKGLLPGTLLYTGEQKLEDVRISVLDFNEKQCKESEPASVEECFAYRDSAALSWINFDGVHRVDLIEKIGEHFNIHPLILEDIVNTDQRPKIEDMGDYLVIILKMIYSSSTGYEIDAEQVSIIVGDSYVITFQEKIGDVFDGIRDRIRNNKGRIRKMKSDFLAYALIDAIVDNYFVVIEKLGEELEDMEDEVIENPTTAALQKLQKMKRQLLFLRKATWPMREISNHFDRSESVLIHKNTRMYLRDIYDHTVQVIDMMETLRDMNTGLFDMYLSTLSNKMNEVMKTLTIIATIFIPLTFIAGIYGMNFQYMPELSWRYGYLGIWGVIGTIFIGMIVYFRKKKWI